jgi:hypothetical protein
MTETKTLILRKVNLFYFAVLLGAAVFAPLLKFQLVSGSLVNAVLFISTVLLGVQSAIFIGLIPSLFALTIGLLPVALVPMVPFIVTSNAILVLIFSFLRKKNFWLGVISASIVKFVFLFASSSLLVSFISNKQTVIAAAKMMSLPQLFTALAGGLIAYLFLRLFKGKNLTNI